MFALLRSTSRSDSHRCFCYELTLQRRIRWCDTAGVRSDPRRVYVSVRGQFFARNTMPSMRSDLGVSYE